MPQREEVCYFGAGPAPLHLEAFSQLLLHGRRNGQMTVTVYSDLTIHAMIDNLAVSTAFVIESICLKANNFHRNLAYLCFAHANCSFVHIVEFTLSAASAQLEQEQNGCTHHLQSIVPTIDYSLKDMRMSDLLIIAQQTNEMDLGTSIGKWMEFGSIALWEYFVLFNGHGRCCFLHSKSHTKVVEEKGFRIDSHCCAGDKQMRLELPCILFATSRRRC